MPVSAAALPVTPDDLAVLRRWAGATQAPAAVARRAEILLLAAQGMANPEIAERLGVSRPTVIAWRKRYDAHQGLIHGLTDRHRRGRPQTVRRTWRAEILATTLAPPPAALGMTHWSSRLLAAELGVSHNALPQFTTNIDGVDIHFLHVRSPHADALPLLITHGWPGSVIELLETSGPLTDPTAHGGQAEDAFHLVLPSLPGYGFSGEPADLGWNVGRVAQAWAELMARLGYTRYVAQGGDVGAVTDAMGRQAPQACSASTPTCW